jgi:transposase-like protein
MSDTFSKIEVITGVARRRRFPTDLKLAIVAETMQPGMSISYCPPAWAVAQPSVPVEKINEPRRQGGRARR